MASTVPPFAVPFDGSNLIRRKTMEIPSCKHTGLYFTNLTSPEACDPGKSNSIDDC